MGQALDACSNSETRKQDATSNKTNKEYNLSPGEALQRSLHNVQENQGNPTHTPLVPVDVIDSRRDMWRWAVGYKIAKQSLAWRVQLTDSNAVITVPQDHIHEPYANLAHTPYFTLYRFSELLGLDKPISPTSTDSPLHLFIDVLDLYYDTQQRVATKWRKAEIVKCNKYMTWVKVHYLGWSTRYDDKINLLEDFHKRVRKFGSMTDVVQPQQKETPLEQQPQAQQLPQQPTKESRFKQQLHNNIRGAMRVFFCKGDGNCLFRAITHQIWGDQEKHMKMRTMCCEYMIQHQIGREMYAQSDHDGYEAYVASKKKNGVWGDDPEIRAMEEMLDVKIEVWNSGLEDGGGIDPSTIHLSGSLPADLQHVNTVRISFHGYNHYNSVVLDGAEPPLLEQFGENAEGEAKTQMIRTWRQNHSSIEVEEGGGGEGGEEDEEEEEEEEEEELSVVF